MRDVVERFLSKTAETHISRIVACLGGNHEGSMCDRHAYHSAPGMLVGTMHIGAVTDRQSYRICTLSRSIDSVCFISTCKGKKNSTDQRHRCSVATDLKRNYRSSARNTAMKKIQKRNTLIN